MISINLNKGPKCCNTIVRNAKLVTLTVHCCLMTVKTMAYTFKESTGENARAKWSESVGANGGVKFKGADKQSDLPSQANFILPSFETWNGNTLNSGSITRTLNIPNGTYTLSIEIAAINQNGNINADNIVLLANGNQLGKLSNQGNSFSNGNVNGVQVYINMKMLLSATDIWHSVFNSMMVTTLTGYCLRT